MNYKITYTKRFIKNLKRLNAAERAQLKKKLEILDIHTLGGGIYSYWPVDYSKPIDNGRLVRVQRKHGCAGHLAVRR